MYDTGKLIDFQLNLKEWNQIEKTENCYPEDDYKILKMSLSKTLFSEFNRDIGL